ncbi:MAG: hypothetical protein EBS01_08150 [Verrucomicrobia bacterium]|nr:hypothetical protein [Verrucomicrobiota bacterium]
MRDFRTLLVASLAVLGTAAATGRADFNALLTPVPGAAVGHGSVAPSAPAITARTLSGRPLIPPE